VVFVERLRVLKTTDAIVDTPGFFSRERSHLGSLLLEGFWVPNSRYVVINSSTVCMRIPISFEYSIAPSVAT
jgi:hypothetical protein